MCIYEIYEHIFLFIPFFIPIFVFPKNGLFMILKRISILNYKNLEQVELDFSAKMNCIIGQNGMGKTNLLDAVYYLSFCKSATNPIDSQNMMHEQDFFMIQGMYETEAGDAEEVYCGMKRRQKKQFKRNKKEYTRLSDHIGFIPLVMVSPADSDLISGGSEERRRFMDVVISQYDKEYLEALIRYNKALQQRNTLLKSEPAPDDELLEVWEEMMAATGEVVYRKRCAFIEEFIPIFQSFYAHISQGKEVVNLAYESHCQQGNLLQLIKESRQRDLIMGYSLRGVHKVSIVVSKPIFSILFISSKSDRNPGAIIYPSPTTQSSFLTVTRTMPSKAVGGVYEFSLGTVLICNVPDSLAIILVTLK